MSPDDEPIPRRWDPLVRPTDPKWIAQASIFRSLLGPASKTTLRSVLDDNFTRAERQLAFPATAPDYLVVAQADNTRRYRKLLGGRFKGEKDDAVTRLTMLYFGLPAEPIMSGMFRAVDPDIEMLDGADARIYEVTPPLHFLTAYDQRNWGRDELRGTEARLSYIPVPLAHAVDLKTGGRHQEEAEAEELLRLEREQREVAEAEAEDESAPQTRTSLRGGGETSGESDEVIMYEPGAAPGVGGKNDEGSDEVVMYEPGAAPHQRGGAPGGSSDDVVMYEPGTALHQRSDGATQQKKRRHLIYGYQGCVSFSADSESLNSAIRSLLSLGEDQEANIVISEFDPGTADGKVPPSLATQFSERFPLGKTSSAGANILEHFRQDPGRHDECCAWFVRFEGEAQPEDYKPTGPLVLGFQRYQSTDGTTAYFPLARTRWQHLELLKDSHVYATYMQEVMHVLGEPRTWPDDNHFSTPAYATGIGAENDARLVYGAPLTPFVFYKHLFRTQRRSVPWDVLEEHYPADCILLCLPGHEPVKVANVGVKDPKEPSQNKVNFAGAAETLKNILRTLLTADAKKRLTRVNVECGSAPRPSEKTRYTKTFSIDCVAADLEPAGAGEGPPKWARPLGDFLANRHTTHHHHFFVLHPVFDRYDVVFEGSIPSGGTAEDVSDKLAVKLKGPKLSHFLNAVDELLIDEKQYPRSHRKFAMVRGVPIVTKDKTNFITFGGVPITTTDNERHPLDPLAVVTLNTSEDEWAAMLKELTGYRLVVSFGEAVAHGRAYDVRRDNTSLWGPRYGEVKRLGYCREIPDEPSRESAPEPATAAKPAKPLPGPSSRPVRLKTAAELEEEKRSKAAGRKPLHPSLFDGGPFPVIPSTGPPRERMIRTSGPGVPYVSNRVMTPTEQMNLQDNYVTSRNTQLRRAVRCNYTGCRFVARADEPEAMEKHLQDTHVAQECPWCTSRLFAHMSPEDKDRHIADEHGAIVKRLASIASNKNKKLSGEDAKAAEKEEKARKAGEEAEARRIQAIREQPCMAPRMMDPLTIADSDEEEYNFCDRCGRDHRQLKDERDRKWHDQLCLPRAPHTGDLDFCTSCGMRTWKSRELTHRNEGADVEWPHYCSIVDAVFDHCDKCGIPKEQMGCDYEHHHNHCRGFSGKVGEFCPYCQSDLSFISNWKLKESHMIACYTALNRHEIQGDGVRAVEVLTPYAIYSSGMWEDPPSRMEEDHFYTGWRQKLPLPRHKVAADQSQTGVDLRQASARAREVLEKPLPESVERARFDPYARAFPAPVIARPTPTQTRFNVPTYPAPSGQEISPPRPAGTPAGPTPGPSRKRPGDGQTPSTNKKQKVVPPPTKTQPGASNVAANPAPPPQKPARKPLPEKRPDQTAAAGKAKGRARPASQSSQAPPPRRRASSSWGPDDPSFVPTAGMYCSRCLRKTMTARPKTGDPSPHDQMEAHMDPKKSCRIRRGHGNQDLHGVGLPNRSGWLNEEDMSHKVSQYKAKFKKASPHYKKTIYPMDGRCTQSIWREDPNNDSNKDNWGLAWPPYTGTTHPKEFPDSEPSSPAPDEDDVDASSEGSGGDEGGESEGDEEGGDDGGQGGNETPGSKKKKPTKVVTKGDKDKTYRDNEEKLSEDEEPDPRKVREDNPDGSPTPIKKKRKRQGNDNSGAEDGATPKAKRNKAKLSPKRPGEEDHAQDVVSVEGGADGADGSPPKS